MYRAYGKDSANPKKAQMKRRPYFCVMASGQWTGERGKEGVWKMAKGRADGPYT